MPAIPRNTKAKSSTLYLSEDVLARINQFAEATVRSKSQSAEYLIRIGMDQFLELGTEEPADAPAPARKPVRGRKKKPRSIHAIPDSELPKKVTTQPAAEIEEPVKPARKPRKTAAKKPAARKAPAKKPAARKPRAKRAA